MIEIVPNWHPIFVHFTVALLSLSVCLFVVTLFVQSPLKGQWRTVSHWLLWFGAGFTIITGLTGLYAYNTVAHDTLSHIAMTDHRNWAVVTIVLFSALAAWSIVRVRRSKALGSIFAICMVIAGGILASTAWRGGEIVYRHGLGVMSLPKAEGDGHSHTHGEVSAQGRNLIQNVASTHGEKNHHEDIEMKTGSVDRMMKDDGHNHQH
jgi:uncharacterized membrane protein